MARQKVTKDMVPDGFSLAMAAVDAIPVVFFGLNCVLLGKHMGSLLFVCGALLCLFAGICKVLWKFAVVLAKKNIWWMFLQMRIWMPAGFLIMLVSCFLSGIRFADFAKEFTSMPSMLFYLGGIAGMVLMGVFAFKLDNADPKANWIEQCTNGAAQILLFIGLLLA